METSYPGCREAVRTAYRLNGAPEESLHIIIASLSDSTYAQYNTAFKKWFNFCLDHSVNPYNSSTKDILKFLSDQFNNGAAEGTLNSYRSAIALLQGPIGENFKIKRFFAGVKRLKPSLPKYDVTWDPQIVLDYISSMPDNINLTLLQLSKKLITLLVTAHRMQTFSLIEVSNIEIISNKIINIKIPARIKTSGKNKVQPTLKIPFFKNNCEVCAAETLVYYLNKTKDLRLDKKYLFIACKKPYSVVTSILFEAGIDTNIFTAHSTRHASTSAAKRSGISLDIIRKTAGWSEQSLTFAKFYDRPIVENNDNAFANAILN